MPVADWEYVGKMLEEAKRRSEEFNGPCLECQHVGASLSEMKFKCRNPILIAQLTTIDSAYSREILADCDWQRGSDNIFGPIICGPPGRLFEVKEPYPSDLFKRIKAMFFG